MNREEFDIWQKGIYETINEASIIGLSQLKGDVGTHNNRTPEQIKANNEKKANLRAKAVEKMQSAASKAGEAIKNGAKAVAQKTGEVVNKAKNALAGRDDRPIGLSSLNKKPNTDSNSASNDRPIGLSGFNKGNTSSTASKFAQGVQNAQANPAPQPKATANTQAIASKKPNAPQLKTDDNKTVTDTVLKRHNKDEGGEKKSLSQKLKDTAKKAIKGANDLKWKAYDAKNFVKDTWNSRDAANKRARGIKDEPKADAKAEENKEVAKENLNKKNNNPQQSTNNRTTTSNSNSGSSNGSSTVRAHVQNHNDEHAKKNAQAKADAEKDREEFFKRVNSKAKGEATKNEIGAEPNAETNTPAEEKKESKAEKLSKNTPKQIGKKEGVKPEAKAEGNKEEKTNLKSKAKEAKQLSFLTKSGKISKKYIQKDNSDNQTPAEENKDNKNEKFGATNNNQSTAENGDQNTNKGKGKIDNQTTNKTGAQVTNNDNNEVGTNKKVTKAKQLINSTPKTISQKDSSDEENIQTLKPGTAKGANTLQRVRTKGKEAPMYTDAKTGKDVPATVADKQAQDKAEGKSDVGTRTPNKILIKKKGTGEVKAVTTDNKEVTTDKKEVTTDERTQEDNKGENSDLISKAKEIKRKGRINLVDGVRHAQERRQAEAEKNKNEATIATSGENSNTSTEADKNKNQATSTAVTGGKNTNPSADNDGKDKNINNNAGTTDKKDEKPTPNKELTDKEKAWKRQARMEKLGEESRQKYLKRQKETANQKGGHEDTRTAEQLEKNNKEIINNANHPNHVKSHYQLSSLDGSKDPETGKQDGKPVDKEKFYKTLDDQNKKIDNETEAEKAKRNSGSTRASNNASGKKADAEEAKKKEQEEKNRTSSFIDSVLNSDDDEPSDAELKKIDKDINKYLGKNKK